MALQNVFGNLALDATVASVLAKLSSDPATQTTLAAVLAKLSSDPATQTTLASILSSVDGLEGFTDGIEGALATLDGKDFATQTSLAAVLAKLSSDPATQTTLAAILAKQIAAPATEAKQDTLIAKDFATQTTLAAIKVKTDNIDVALSTRTKPADTQTVGGTVAVSNMIAAVETGLAKDASIGSLTETAPATDTASSGLNGRLQRIAQRLTALFPTSLGQKTKANSLAVTLASDQDALPITDNAGSLTVDGTVSAAQSGTWTVQPGNTANTTAWKVDGSAVTQPVSGTVTAAVQTVSSTTVAQIASSATNVTLQASNASRKGLLIFNDSTQILRVKFGATASATSYTVQIGPGGYYEMPTRPIYTGIVDGIWASANGNAYVTEL